MCDIDRQKIFFTSDLHLGHKRILDFFTKRKEIFKIEENNVEGMVQHDTSIIKLWNKLVGKHDTVYILGDFSFKNPEETTKIIEQLNGKKHLIIGNHDKSCRHLSNYFLSTSHIKEVTFKTHLFPFLDEDLHCILCHFPMLAWNRRMFGSCMIHGHSHGELCDINSNSEELRVDVGFDAKLANHNLIELEELYNHFKYNVCKGKTFKEHIDYLTNKTGLKI